MVQVVNIIKRAMCLEATFGRWTEYEEIIYLTMYGLSENKVNSLKVPWKLGTAQDFWSTNISGIKSSKLAFA